MTNSTYVGRIDSTRASEKIFTETACYQCFLVTHRFDEVPCYRFKMFWRQPNTRRERSYRRRLPLILRGPNADDSNRAATYIEYLVDGLAGNMRSAAASD